MEENPMFKKLIEKKKKDSPASPMELKAKGSVLADLMQEIGNMGADKLKGLQKVTVAAPDQDALKLGLDKAKELVAKDPLSEEDSEESEESPEEEASESPSEELSEQEEPSKEDLEKQIAELQLKLAHLKG